MSTAVAVAVPHTAAQDPDRVYELMTRELSAVRLRKCARRLMMAELAKLPDLPPMDPRDWPEFLAGVTAEYQSQHRLDQWPAAVYEEYSPDTPQPRSAALIEALQFFNMTGRTAIIVDSAPWTQRMGWMPDQRTGHTAVLLVF